MKELTSENKLKQQIHEKYKDTYDNVIFTLVDEIKCLKARIKELETEKKLSYGRLKCKK